MEGKWLRMFAAACLAALASVGGVQAQSESVEDVQEESFLPSPPPLVLDRFDAVPVQDQLNLSRIAPGIKPKRMVVSLRDGATVPDATAAGPTDRLVYSNTLGRVAVDFGANRLLSDDITITSTGRNASDVTCRLTRMAFQVDGRVSEAMGTPSGPYSVNFALYNTCPYAVTAGIQRNSRIIANSAGTVQVDDDAPLWIEVAFPADLPVYAYTNMWFAVQFSRANAGLISGTPAQVGHSGDAFDFPGSACQASLGGFPTAPHASFNLELWGDTMSCPETYVAYKNIRESGSGINAGGTQTGDWITDDITLQNACTVKGFTVGVRAPGTYKFELRSDCGAPAPIGGFTATQLVGQSSGQEPRVFEYLLPSPVGVGQALSFAVNVNNLGAGAIVTGAQATIGQTLDFFQVTPACSPQDYRQGQDALQFSLICQGPAPTGACCEMYLNECDGGMLDGELCDATADCQPTCSGGFCKIGDVTILNEQGQATACTNNSQCLGGSCTAPCKNIPQTNCAFPPRFTALDPAWAPGKLCANDAAGGVLDPFPNVLCGQAACCYEDTNDIQQCKNVTRDGCDLQQPVEQPKYWALGRFCGAEQFTCPIVACLGRLGGCFSGCPHEQGCGDLDCCTDVCLFDDFCCNVEWDCPCQDAAIDLCDTLPTNDSCGPTPANQRAGATLKSVPDDFKDAFPQATALDTTDPPMCCHNGLPLMCQSGDFIYRTCTEATVEEDCRNILNPNVECGPRIDKPFASLWYKFVATNTSVQIQTCSSSSTDATNSIIEVFAVGDPNATTDAQACPSLVPIACSDDIPSGCGIGGKLSRVCAEGLTVGETYYFLVGGKSYETRGEYRVTISPSACSVAGDVDHDWCNRGLDIIDGPPEDPEIVPFNMTGSTLNCPAAGCDPAATKDLWYDYTASCTGVATVDTCASGNPSTNLVVYEGCECPGTNEQPISCTTEGPAGCATTDEFPVVAGGCYKIRLDNDGTNTPTGQLRLKCASLCDPGPVTFDPPNNVVDAGVPSDINNASMQKGIQQIKVLGPMGLEDPNLCFVLDCETNPFGTPNEIVPNGVVEGPPGTYTVTLAKPLSPNGVTQLRYLGNAPGDPTTRGRFTTHLGNVDGDFAAFPDQDIQKLVDVLNGLASEPPFVVGVPWGKYGTDIDRSGNPTALDLLELLNLFNGAGVYPDPYLELKPSAATCPL